MIMISGANEDELELASARMDIMLATNYTPNNPGPLAIIDKYHDKEIERLNNIIDELEKYIKDTKKYSNMIYMDMEFIKINDILDKLKELRNKNDK